MIGAALKPPNLALASARFLVAVALLVCLLVFLLLSDYVPFRELERLQAVGEMVGEPLVVLLLQPFLVDELFKILAVGVNGIE